MRRTAATVTQAELRILTLIRNPPYERNYEYGLAKECGWSQNRARKVLAALERWGRARSVWAPAPDLPGRPLRKYYEITAEGRRILEDRQPAWEDPTLDDVRARPQHSEQFLTAVLPTPLPEQRAWGRREHVTEGAV